MQWYSANIGEQEQGIKRAKKDGGQNSRAIRGEGRQTGHMDSERAIGEGAGKDSCEPQRRIRGR